MRQDRNIVTFIVELIFSVTWPVDAFASSLRYFLAILQGSLVLKTVLLFEAIVIIWVQKPLGAFVEAIGIVGFYILLMAVEFVTELLSTMGKGVEVDCIVTEVSPDVTQIEIVVPVSLSEALLLHFVTGVKLSALVALLHFGIKELFLLL